MHTDRYRLFSYEAEFTYTEEFKLADSNITKKALAAAFKELTEEIVFDKITIGHICEKCDMNRKSFYYHFKDKYDLIEWIYYTEFISEMERKTHSDIKSILLDICLYFEENRKFYCKILKYDGQNSFCECFKKLLLPRIEKSILRIFENDDNNAFYISFLSDTFINAIRKWMLTQENTSAGKFVSLMLSCIQGVAEDVRSNV